MDVHNGQNHIKLFAVHDRPSSSALSGPKTPRIPKSDFFGIPALLMICF